MAYSDTYDVVVVGGGGAGLAAAVAAAERGASVAVVERKDELGGTTAYSVGSLTAADTPLQRRKGIRDDPDELVEDMWAFDPALLDGDAPALRRLYAVESARTYDWLVEHGVVFSGPYPEPPHRVPRMHNVIPNSRSYIARLASAARRAGVEVMLRTEAVRLHLDGDRGQRPGNQRVRRWSTPAFGPPQRHPGQRRLQCERDYAQGVSAGGRARGDPDQQRRAGARPSARRRSRGRTVADGPAIRSAAALSSAAESWSDRTASAVAVVVLVGRSCGA